MRDREPEKLPQHWTILGNIFELETSAVTFPPSGGLDPFVNIVATATTSEARVTATVKGRATKPDLILTSEPTMSQYQIVTLLITGRSDASGERETEVDVPTQVASLLLSFNNPVLERQLYQKLGVDRIAVSVGSSMAEPILVVGKRVSRRIYIESEYHHNAPSDENRASGRVEYRLAPGWTLETEYGDAQKGEVGVFWQKRFGEQDGRAEK
jgi:autotransporter translocation and assembly factor TamB